MFKFNNSGKPASRTIIIIAILFVAIGVFLVVNSMQSENNSPADNLSGETEINHNEETPNQTGVKKEGWEIYQNQDYKFEFQYPENTMTLLPEPKQEYGYCNTIEEEDSCVRYADSVESSIEGMPIYQGIGILVVNRALDDQSIHKYDEFPLVGQMVDVTEEILIDGKIAYKFDLVTATNYKIRGFMAPLNSENFLEISENSKYPAVTEEDWEEIISTFKFL